MMWILRLLVGVIFTTSGFEKASSPSGNFLYVIQQYQVLPQPLAKLTSVVFPWAELLIGIFLILGLWTLIVLRFSALTSFSLALLVGQAIIRRLPIDDCGCFGQLVHLPLWGVIFLDIAMLAAALACMKHIDQASRVSLDRLFSPKT